MSCTVFEIWTEVRAWIDFLRGQTEVSIPDGIGQKTCLWNIAGDPKEKDC